MGVMSPDETKALVLKAFDTLFNERDYAKAAEFWSQNCIQHSAHIDPHGRSRRARRSPSRGAG